MKQILFPRTRAAGLLLLSLVAVWGVAALTESLRHAAPDGFDHLLAAGAAWMLLGAAAWGALLCAAATVEAASAGRLRATAWVACPPSLRRALLAGVGITLVAAPGSPAAGADLRPPARPTGGVVEVRERVLVLPGDALWRIAERRLPADARTAEVAALVQRVHHRNRHVIGPDPDLIRPGQRLVVPATAHESSRHHQE